MRGSVYFQTAQLAKVIFKEGSLKVDRVNPDHDHYQCVASFSTMEAYRQIWNNFGKYLREVWGIKNFEKVDSKHTEDYIEMKIHDGLSKQYIEKIGAAFSKLEIVLRKFNENYSTTNKVYDFQKTNTVIAQAKICDKIASSYHNRAYLQPEKLIEKLDNKMFQLAATIQLEGGARFKGVRRIKINQLQGKKIDPISGSLCGIIETKEKGGRIGDVMVKIDTYNNLKMILLREKEFKIDYEKYAEAIRDASKKLNIECHGSHGFRWNFAKRRLVEYQYAGYSYDDSLGKVSAEMKHNRKDITEHYLG